MTPDRNKNKSPRRSLTPAAPVPPGKLLAAVSGGADSVAMLLLLLDNSAEVEVANCNFHLRGEEADRDSRFVEELCRRLDLTLHKADFRADEYARSHGVSVEMACRDLRHDWWRRLCREGGFSRVVTGHNASDNVETLFLNLLRGSGVEGLKGMLADDGRIYRPLLTSSRAEILAFLESRGEGFVTDSSNLSSDYRRNFIRNEVMPMLRSRWPGADKALMRSLDVIGREWKIVRHSIAHALDGCGEILFWEKISNFPDPQSLIFHFLKPAGGSPEIAAEIAALLASSLEDDSVTLVGKRWHLPAGVEAVASVSGLEIVSAQVDVPDFEWHEVELSPEVWRRVRSCGHDSVWLPEGEDAYEFRLPVAGDRIRPLGMKGSRLVSDVIAEGKLSSARKRGLRVLVSKKNEEVIWVPGLKRSRYDLINRDAKSAFFVSLKKKS